MNATTMTTPLDGIQISYMDRPGRDPAIVCMHANSLNKDAFTDLINQDAVSANRIVAFNLPGHLPRMDVVADILGDLLSETGTADG